MTTPRRTARPPCVLSSPQRRASPGCRPRTPPPVTQPEVISQLTTTLLRQHGLPGMLAVLMSSSLRRSVRAYGTCPPLPPRGWEVARRLWLSRLSRPLPHLLEVRRWQTPRAAMSRGASLGLAGCLRLTCLPTAPASGAVESLSPTCRTEMSSLRFRAVRPARCRVANFTAQIAKPCRAGLAPGITWQASGKASTTRARACTAAAARVHVSSAKTRRPRPRSDSLLSAVWDHLRPSIPGWR